MGVYYRASIGWGLRVPRTDALYGQDLEDVYDIPPGFVYSAGGDLIDSVDEAYLIHPPGAIQNLLSTLEFREDRLGVHAVRDMYRHTDKELDALVVFARQNGLDEDIGWFAISSVD